MTWLSEDIDFTPEEEARLDKAWRQIASRMRAKGVLPPAVGGEDDADDGEGGRASYEAQVLRTLHDALKRADGAVDDADD